MEPPLFKVDKFRTPNKSQCYEGETHLDRTQDLLTFQQSVFDADLSCVIPKKENQGNPENRNCKSPEYPLDHSSNKDFQIEQRKSRNPFLNRFSDWNFIVSEKGIASISNHLKKNGSRNSSKRRAKSSPVLKRHTNVEFHPQLTEMLYKWKKKFNKFQKKNSLCQNDHLSKQKLTFIKSNKNNELSILDLDHRIERNLCKDDLFVRRDTFSPSMRLVLKFKTNKQKQESNSLSKKYNKQQDLLEGKQDYTPSKLNNQKDEQFFNHGMENNPKRRILSKLKKMAAFFSPCSTKNSQMLKIFQTTAKEIFQNENQTNMVGEIKYEFQISRKKEKIDLELLRVVFKDSNGKIVMM